MDKKRDCDTCYKIFCKRCGWEADEFAASEIKVGELTACPKCCRPLSDKVSDRDNRRKVMRFLKSHHLAVIATQNKEKNKPESALIAFVEDENFCLYFQTGKYTRKAKNLGTNLHVSLVIGLTLEDMATIQYEGKVDVLQDPQLIVECKRRFLEKKSPTTVKHLERADALFYKVTPTWIRFSDDTKGGPSSVIVLIRGSIIGEISKDASESYSFDHKGRCGNCGINSTELGPCMICITCDAKMGGKGLKILAKEKEQIFDIKYEI
jgi:uncharacterized protein YhbP (UPF0306 family)